MTVEEHNFAALEEYAKDNGGRVDPFFARYLGALTARGVRYRACVVDDYSTTSIRIEQKLPDTGRTATTIDGTTFVPTMIEHRAYIFEGDFYRNASLLNEDFTNVSLYGDDINDWCRAPAWFDAAAKRLEARTQIGQDS